MARRANPLRLRGARRAATIARLGGVEGPPEDAERLVTAWEVPAARGRLEGGGRYWHGGCAWITDQRR